MTVTLSNFVVEPFLSSWLFSYHHACSVSDRKILVKQLPLINFVWIQNSARLYKPCNWKVLKLGLLLALNSIHQILWLCLAHVLMPMLLSARSNHTIITISIITRDDVWTSIVWTFVSPIQVNSNCTIVRVYDYVACIDCGNHKRFSIPQFLRRFDALMLIQAWYSQLQGSEFSSIIELWSSLLVHPVSKEHCRWAVYYVLCITINFTKTTVCI